MKLQLSFLFCEQDLADSDFFPSHLWFKVDKKKMLLFSLDNWIITPMLAVFAVEDEN